MVAIGSTSSLAITRTLAPPRLGGGMEKLSHGSVVAEIPTQQICLALATIADG